MSNLANYPSNYLLFNDQVTKNVNIAIEIEDVSEIISFVPIFKRILYGDPDIHFGDPGLVYGGLVGFKSSAFKNIISLDSNLVLSQTIEPEQGRSSVSTMTINLIDKDQFVTNLVTPGKVVDEIMGNKMFTIRLGYQQTSYPQDYFTVFRGYVSSITYSAGKYMIQLSDANAKKRAQLFFSGTTTVNGTVNPGDTTITTVSTADFFNPIQGPSGTFDSSVTPYLIIGSEVIAYTHGSVGTNTFSSLTRGARGTTAAAAAIGDAVANAVQLQGNGIDLALKMMLSGWNGPWITGVPILTIQDTLSVGLLANAMLMPVGVDTSDKYGLTVGDWVTVSGSTAGNNGTYQIAEIDSINGGSNNLLKMATNFASVENPATTVQVAFRSQYDTLPITMGLKMKPTEVDVSQFQTIKQNFFSQSQYTLQFYETGTQDGKQFIDSEIMLPFGAYSLTRYGRISMTVTKPPIAGEILPVLDETSVIEPNSISVIRAINNRRYFNEIQYQYDVDDSGNFTSVQSIVDTESLSKVDVSSVLPIPSNGFKTSLGAAAAIARQGTFLINRFKTGAITFTMKVNWRVGSVIETGDTVLISDNGDLQIANFATGERNLNQQIVEVIDRKYDIKNGTVELKLLGNLNYQISDRFATISPSSIIQAGSTTTRIVIADSFGALYIGNEAQKYANLNGTNLNIHSFDYTTYNQTTTLVGFDAVNPNIMIVSPALSSPPPAGTIIDIDFYPSSTDPLDQQIQKILFAHLDPSVAVATGISSTKFTVGAGDIAKFTKGLPVLIHSSDYSVLSPECQITDITGTTITVGTSLGFTPSMGQTVELIGYIDGGGPFRFL